MKTIYKTPVAVCCPMTAQGYLLAGSNRIPGAVVEDKNKGKEYKMNVGRDEEDITGTAKKSFDPWDAWDE